jgi:hypothetical protein
VDTFTESNDIMNALVWEPRLASAPHLCTSQNLPCQQHHGCKYLFTPSYFWALLPVRLGHVRRRFLL